MNDKEGSESGSRRVVRGKAWALRSDSCREGLSGAMNFAVNRRRVWRMLYSYESCINSMS